VSRSDWIKFGKIVGLASGVFTLALLIYSAGYRIGNVSGHYDSDADSTATQYPSDTQRIIDDCFKLPTRLATNQCVGDAIKASHENQRAEQDLKAQREMSDWGWWALVISGLQFLATIVTLGFIKLTLDATLEAVKDTGRATDAMLEANQIARQSSKIQLRPYLAGEGAVVSEVACDDGNFDQIVFKISNKGVTPALMTGITVRLWHLSGQARALIFDKSLPAKASVAGSVDGVKIPARLEMEVEEEPLYLGAYETGSFLINFIIEYKDVFEDTHTVGMIYRTGASFWDEYPKEHECDAYDQGTHFPR
jgi:hypothetical protein